MIYRKVINDYCENNTKLLNTPCGKNDPRFLMFS